MLTSQLEQYAHLTGTEAPTSTSEDGDPEGSCTFEPVKHFAHVHLHAIRHGIELLWAVHLDLQDMGTRRREEKVLADLRQRHARCPIAAAHCGAQRCFAVINTLSGGNRSSSALVGTKLVVAGQPLCGRNRPLEAGAQLYNDEICQAPSAADSETASEAASER